MFLSIGAAALLLGVSVVTLRRWEKSSQLVPSHRTLGGHRRYDKQVLSDRFFPLEQADPKAPALAYARVSSRDQAADLATQKEKLEAYCRQHFSTHEVICDLGSGLNYKKPGLVRLLNLIHQGRISHLVINHKDRLLRFGSEIIFSLCKAKGIGVTVLEDDPSESFEVALSHDVIELMTVFSARLYGRRSHKNKAALA